MREEDINKIDEMFKSNRSKTNSSLKCYFETLKLIIIDWNDLMT